MALHVLIRYVVQGAHHVSNASVHGASQLDYEEKTFEIMWEMSSPGSDSEECFLRLPQAEYSFEEPGQIPEPLEKMPNVCLSPMFNINPDCSRNSSDISIQMNSPQTLNLGKHLRPSRLIPRSTLTTFLQHF